MKTRRRAMFGGRSRWLSRGAALVAAAGMVAAAWGGAVSMAASPGPVVLSTVSGTFFDSAYTAPDFTPSPGSIPVFSESFPSLDFNPPTASGMLAACGASRPDVTDATLPFTDVAPLLGGGCATVPAEAPGEQAGVGDLASFAAEFTGTMTVSASEDVTFDVWTNDGYLLGMGQSGGAQPSYSSGDLDNSPAITPFNHYTVVGAYDEGNSSTDRAVTVYFPTAGTYPFELDYYQAWGAPLALTLTSPQGIAFSEVPVVTAAGGSPTSVTVSGDDLGPSPGSVTLRDPSTGAYLPAAITSWSPTSVTAAPQTALTAGHTYTAMVTDDQGRASNAVPFSTAGSGPLLDMSPAPIAPTGGLGPLSDRQVTVSVQDLTGTQESVNLWFTPAPGGGSAYVETGGGPVALGPAPRAVTTDDAGEVTVTYETPAVLPSGGTDALTAEAALTVGTVSLVDTYTFATQSPPQGTLAVQPGAQSVSQGGSVTVALVGTPPGGESIGAYTVGLGFSPYTLTPTSYTDAYGVCNLAYGSGEIRCDGAIPAGAPGATALATITFTASGPAGATASLNPSSDGVTDPSGDPLDLVPAGATVSISGSSPSLSRIFPNSGWPGRTDVWLTGSGLAAAYGTSGSVSFGAAAGTELGVNASGTQMSAITPSAPGAAFGDVTGDGAANGEDALCILRAALGLSQAQGTCVDMRQTVTVTVTDPDGQTASLANAYTYDRFDVSGADHGTPDATDALCVLRLGVGLGPTDACPSPSAVATAARRAPPRTARAVPSRTLSLSPAARTVRAGKTVTLTLAGDVATPGLGAWTLSLSYAPRLLRVDACTAAAGTSLCNAAYGKGIVRLAGASASGVSGHTVLATVTFTALRRGTDRVRASAVSAADPSGAALFLRAAQSVLRVVAAH